MEVGDTHADSSSPLLLPHTPAACKDQFATLHPPHVSPHLHPHIFYNTNRSSVPFFAVWPIILCNYYFLRVMQMKSHLEIVIYSCHSSANYSIITQSICLPIQLIIKAELNLALLRPPKFPDTKHDERIKVYIYSVPKILIRDKYIGTNDTQDLLTDRTRMGNTLPLWWLGRSLGRKEVGAGPHTQHWLSQSWRPCMRIRNTEYWHSKCCRARGSVLPSQYIQLSYNLCSLLDTWKLRIIFDNTFWLQGTLLTNLE